MTQPAARHRIAIVGASGRMGRMLVEAIVASDDCELSGASDVAGSAAIGQDAGAALGVATGVQITANLADSLANAQFLIDFTRPEGTLAHAALCAERGIKLVIGTTGFDADGKQHITQAAQRVAIMMAPNMSVGVNVTLKLLEQAAHALSSGYDVEITEAHHRHKVDAPSGTALKMGEVIASAWGTSLAERAVYARHGITGERDAGSIGFACVRGGDIVGDHTVLFAGTGERIEITHKSSSRMTYALGSLRAVRFLATRSSGLYDMYDVLGLN
jgi:4-hydroxy-tetrahydrodipicolinate reductase